VLDTIGPTSIPFSFKSLNNSSSSRASTSTPSTVREFSSVTLFLDFFGDLELDLDSLDVELTFVNLDAVLALLLGDLLMEISSSEEKSPEPFSRGATCSSYRATSSSFFALSGGSDDTPWLMSALRNSSLVKVDMVMNI